MTNNITMKTVAAHAGVTAATVSLCLANNPRVPSATRARIRDIADRLGYRPNPYVSVLMRIRRCGRTRQERPVLALVNTFDSPDGWRTSSALTVQQMRTGAIEQAARRGYHTEEFWLHRQEMTPERFSGMLHHRGIHGILLGPLAPDAGVPALRWDRFAVVRLGVPLPTPALTSVCNDHFFSSLQIAREAHGRGYRRPGLVLLRMHRARFHGRWDGGLNVARHLLRGMRPTKTLLLDDWEDLSPVAEWLERNRPDVVISPGAELLLPHIERLGWSPPRDLGLASLACPSLGSRCSGIWQNGTLIGATAVDSLIHLVERNERGLAAHPKAIMIEGSWNEGRTLRAASEGT